MAEYIECEELLKRFNSNDVVHKMDNENFHYKQGYLTGLITASVVAKAMPSADVVEVVRCRQCGNYCKNTGECNLYGRHPNENDFCSNGVLKECEG